MTKEEALRRNQKISGANAFMDQGYITERDIPAMMNRDFAQKFVLDVQDELQLRSLQVQVALQTFDYYMGSGSIIYNPKVLDEDSARETLRLALGYRK